MTSFENLSKSDAKGMKKRLEDERDETLDQLSEAQRKEREHFRAQGRWDVEGQKPIPVKASWHIWKGSDWEPEEKRELNTAWAALGLGGVLSAISIVNAVFSLKAAHEGEEAGHSRLEEEMASRNTTSETNKHLESAAEWSYDSTVVQTVSVGGVGLVAIAAGVRDWRRACVKHAERLEKLNHPEETVQRENLKAHLDDVLDKLAKVEERLTELAEQAKAESLRLAQGVDRVKKAQRKKKEKVLRIVESSSSVVGSSSSSSSSD